MAIVHTSEDSRFAKLTLKCQRKLWITFDEEIPRKFRMFKELYYNHDSNSFKIYNFFFFFFASSFSVYSIKDEN